MTDKYIPTTLNLALCTAFISIFAALHFIVPLYIVVWPSFIILLVIALIPLNMPLWSLIHEAIHSNLHPNRRVNNTMGRTLSALFGVSFHIVRFGHLMHHRFNRTWESEFYDTRNGNRFLIHLQYYLNLLGGLYITEIVMTFMVALVPRALAIRICAFHFHDPEQQTAITNGLLKPETINAIRVDAVLIAALYTTSFILFGPYWYVLLIAIMGRAILISVMDNAYHYGLSLDDTAPAKELELHRALETFMLNFNYHRTHHTNAGLPWTALRAHHQHQGSLFSGRFISTVLAQFKGPLPLELQQPT